MNLIDRVILEWSYRTKKGYPDINNAEDMRVFESIFGFDLITEKKLEWKDLSDASRKYVRLSIMADMISSGTPFELENGQKTPLTFSKPEYADLFANQEVDKIRTIGGVRINLFPFFKDSNGNDIAFREIKKTKELGGTGAPKAQTSERQERALIEAINSVEGEKILRGANGIEIKGVISAEKQPDPPRAEAYADLRLNLKGGGTYLLSAKGTQTPSVAGGGLTGITQISKDLASFVKKFYEDAYLHYKKIADQENIQPDTNLYMTPTFKDVNREVPQEVVLDMLRGNEAMGGPVDGYYIGPMTVEYEVNGSTIKTNGDIFSIEDYAKKYPSLYAHIKKRSGDYFFTDDLQTVNGNTMPLIFTNKPGGKMAKSRFGVNTKPRGKVLI